MFISFTARDLGLMGELMGRGEAEGVFQEMVSTLPVYGRQECDTRTKPLGIALSPLEC